MSDHNKPVPDDKPSPRYIKIKMKPKGEINIGSNGGTPSNYHISVLNFTSNPGHNEPSCTNTPFNATWNSSQNQYVGTGDFDGTLIPGVDVYTVEIQFVRNGGGAEPSESFQGEVVVA